MNKPRFISIKIDISSLCCKFSNVNMEWKYEGITCSWWNLSSNPWYANRFDTQNLNQSDQSHKMSWWKTNYYSSKYSRIFSHNSINRSLWYNIIQDLNLWALAWYIGVSVLKPQYDLTHDTSRHSGISKSFFLYHNDFSVLLGRKRRLTNKIH